MQDITTDPIANKQTHNEEDLQSVIENYPSLWLKMVSDWLNQDQVDKVWLLYSANYLLRTAGVRWALDPITLRHRLPATPDVDISDLAALDFILLTHRHNDHFDLNLLKALQKYPACWVIPEFLFHFFSQQGLLPNKFIIPSSMVPIQFGELILTPFNGFHWEFDVINPARLRGVPSMGYLAEFNGKRCLFPGDTRKYHRDALRLFDPVDILFSHLWLGRGCALQEIPTLLDEFCNFCLSSNPNRIIFTHLEEFGRLPEDFWNFRHFDLIKNWFGKQNYNLSIESAYMGDSILLDTNNRT